MPFFRFRGQVYTLTITVILNAVEIECGTDTSVPYMPYMFGIFLDC